MFTIISPRSGQFMTCNVFYIAEPRMRQKANRMYHGQLPGVCRIALVYLLHGDLYSKLKYHYGRSWIRCYFGFWSACQSWDYLVMSPDVVPYVPPGFSIVFQCQCDQRQIRFAGLLLISVIPGAVI